MSESFSVGAVTKACGISYRNADYWIRRRYVLIDNPTPGSGQARRLSFREALRVKVMSEAVRSGLRASAVNVEGLIESGYQHLNWATLELPVAVFADELRMSLEKQGA